MKSSAVKCIAAAMFALAASTAAAQDYPAKPLKLIVPFPAGGPADTIGRVYAEKLSALMGQPIVIENRGGAGGVTGIALVSKSDADGYTIGIATSGTLAMNVVLQEKMPYDPLKDLTLVTQAASVPELLVVGPQVPAKTLAEFVALAKAQPGKINFASTGLGSMPHMAAELFKATAGIDIVHVPYAGAAPAVNDMLGGHVQMLFADVPVLLGSVQAGKLGRSPSPASSGSACCPTSRPPANSAWRRSTPTTGMASCRRPTFQPAIAAKLHDKSVEALKSAEVTEKLGRQGVLTVGSSTATFTAYVKGEIQRWGGVVKAAGIKLK